MFTNSAYCRAFILIIAVLLNSCDEPFENQTRQELLAGTSVNGKNYFIRSAEIKLQDLAGTVSLEECVIDNTVIYYPSGRYEENEGRTKCHPDDEPGLVGSWELNADQNLLTVIKGLDIEVWDIVRIDQEEVWITKAESNGEITFILEAL